MIYFTLLTCASACVPWFVGSSAVADEIDDADYLLDACDDQIATVSDITVGDWVEEVRLNRKGRVVKTDRHGKRYLVRFRDVGEVWFNSEELRLRPFSSYSEKPAAVIDGVEIGSEVVFRTDEGEVLRGTAIGYNRRFRTFTLKSYRLFEITRFHIITPKRPTCCCYL